MTGSRQDAWSTDDDIILAEIVLRHVREGSTQLAAFEEAGNKLSRTAAACGFRWNACIRKKYEAAIEIARKQREHRQGSSDQEKEEDHDFSRAATSTFAAEEMTLERSAAIKASDSMSARLGETIEFLKQVSQFIENNDRTEVAPLLERKRHMERENEELTEELDRVKQDFRRLREDYRALLEVMEKARALSEGVLPYLQGDKIEESG